MMGQSDTMSDGPLPPGRSDTAVKITYYTGNWSMVQMGHNSGWVTWATGRTSHSCGLNIIIALCSVEQHLH